MKKDAGIASVLNAVLPGLGWLYIEFLSVGIISILIYIGLSFWIFNSSTVVPMLIFGIYWWIQIISVHSNVSKMYNENKTANTKNRIVSEWLNTLKE